MAEGAVTFLLENVQKLLIHQFHQIHLISGAENELKQLENELELMKAFLQDSSKMPEKGERFRIFESQIREVVYQAEDTVDRCLSQAIAEKSSVFPKLILKRLSFAKEVKSVREDKVKPIFNEAKFHFATLQIAEPSGISSQETGDKTKKGPLLRQDNIVGFEGEADTVIKYLNQESDELEVISIIGMPGLGKTTLAWKIYRDQRIQYEFPTLIWVYVSQDFRRRDVFLTILKKSEQDMSSKTDDELVQMVQSNLETAKFLLVMDDVWTCEAWKEIEAALPRKNSLGKVRITSRHEKVARRANRKREPHKLRFLDFKESWDLLQLEVFGKVDECPLELEEHGKLIAKQCGGVPLAIVVIGGILFDKYSGIGGMKKAINEWKNVSACVSAYLNEDKEKRTEKIISLSYNKLPHDLRDCFLYLGMFPEDTEIPTWKLIRLWIAEGFIRQKPENSLEEVALDNLEDLINRNLVMVGKTKAEGEVKTCRVHDMIREFCKNEAGIMKQNLFQEIKRSKDRVFDPPVIQKQRRLCIHSNVLDFIQRKPKSQLVRSFLCFSKEVVNLPRECIPLILDAFTLLRVFDVNPIKFNKFPTKITQLVHLRYIALSGDDFRALPDVSNLWNLQTIIIETLLRKFIIKADIWKMTQLRHLKTKAAIVLNKDAKGKAGENLQTLSRLSAECCTEEVFKRAPNLKNLGIRGKLATLLHANCLEKLDRLQKLKLVYDVFPDVASENRLQGFPQPDSFPPNLKILELSATFLEWKHMSTLAMLSGLEVLKLKENAFIGKCWSTAGGGFLSLEFLHIGRTDLEYWTVLADSFPRLKCLVLKNCEKLVEIPPMIAKNLEILDIERVTKSAVASAKKIEQGKQQLQGHQRARRGGFKLIIAPGDN